MESCRIASPETVKELTEEALKSSMHLTFRTSTPCFTLYPSSTGKRGDITMDLHATSIGISFAFPKAISSAALASNTACSAVSANTEASILFSI